MPPTPEPVAPPAPAPRVVLFMTAPSADDIPAGDVSLGCLLPFGTSSFAERVLDSCAQAGLKDVDLVVSEHPENLRKRLGDGSQWGLKLTWHLAKMTATPYTVLRGMALPPGQRVLIGHGQRWVSERIVRALLQQDHVAVHLGDTLAWTGWLSTDSESIRNIPTHADFEMLTAVAMQANPRHELVTGAHEFAQCDSAAELLQAQDMVLQDTAGDTVPASWLRMPWGAMSPYAIVHPQAQMTGPVLVGERCTVGRDAKIGPCTVLSRNVLVAEGAVISHSLVLPKTHVGSQVTLEHVVVQGNVVQNLKWSVRMTLPREDALLTPLFDVADVRSPWLARLVALLLFALATPLMGVLVALQALRGKPVGWTTLRAVTKRAEAGDQLCYRQVRQPRPDADGPGQLLGHGGALLDVFQGRRNWFGIRPREASQWYALSKDWQVLFGRTPIGFFHAPAWTGQQDTDGAESLAAADAYFAIRAGLREYLRIMAAWARSPASRAQGNHL